MNNDQIKSEFEQEKEADRRGGMMVIVYCVLFSLGGVVVLLWLLIG